MKQRGVFEKIPGSGTFWIRYADGTGRIRREKAGTKSSAIALYRKRKTQILEGKKLPETMRKGSVSFEELSNDALEYSRTSKVREAYRIDRWRMATLLAWFRGSSASELNAQDVERKLNELAAADLAPATVNRYRTLLSLVFSLGIRNGKISVNPVRLVKRRRENNERVRFLEFEEETALRSEIRKSYPLREPEFDLAIHTGMRRAEQYGLLWQNVDLKRGIITIPRSKHGEVRHIQINSSARVALDVLRSGSGGLGRVCPEANGPESREAREWFNKVMADAKIQNFRWHDLRHTFASRLVMAGANLRAVQTLLGHKRMETTLRYSHLGESHLRDAVELLAAKRTDTTTDTEKNQMPVVAFKATA